MNDSEKINLLTLDNFDSNLNKSTQFKEFILFGKKRIFPNCSNSIGLYFTLFLLIMPTVIYFTM